MGAMSCFARADYNLPLYAFLYLMWREEMNVRIWVEIKCIVKQIQDGFLVIHHMDCRPLMALLLGTTLAFR